MNSDDRMALYVLATAEAILRVAITFAQEAAEDKQLIHHRLAACAAFTVRETSSPMTHEETPRVWVNISDAGVHGLHDNYGFALAAQSGRSQGFFAKTSK